MLPKASPRKDEILDLCAAAEIEDRHDARTEQDAELTDIGERISLVDANTVAISMAKSVAHLKTRYITSPLHTHSSELLMYYNSATRVFAHLFAMRGFWCMCTIMLYVACYPCGLGRFEELEELYKAS